MSEPVATRWSDETPEGAVIRIEQWPEGYILWYHGEIAWKSYGKVTPSPDMPASGMMKPPEVARENSYAILLAAQALPDPSEAMIAHGAHILSEWLDDAAPLHERRYRDPAKAVLKFGALYAIPPDYAKRIAELEGERDLARGSEAYALICLEREISIAQSAQRREAELEAQLTALRSLVTEAAKVLGPFAAFAPQAEHFVQARVADGRTAMFPTKHFRLRHFEAAAALLSRLNEAVKP